MRTNDNDNWKLVQLIIESENIEKLLEIINIAKKFKFCNTGPRLF